MNKSLLFVLLTSVLVLTACENLNQIEDSSNIICNSPYIRFETGCCLDQNNNRICDEDEGITINITNTSETNSSLVAEVVDLENAGMFIANSQDWKDVYSTILYANLLGIPNTFLANVSNASISLYEIPKERVIHVISSADKPYYNDYESLIRSRGYPDPKEFMLNDINLELAKRLQDIDKFIIIDDTHGYEAISVAPYAVRAKYYVLFVNENNIENTVTFLNQQKPASLIIYGSAVSYATDKLRKFNPEMISEGGKYADNMRLVDKYSQSNSIKEVILTDGKFIEPSMMSGKAAVLFIGKDDVPEEVKTYIKDKQIDIGVLIGTESVDSATIIRRQLGISVFVKFAYGARVPGGTPTPIMSLNILPVPS